jgi:hypothetical protein
MPKDSNGQNIISNKFGTISDKQVIFLSKKSLFGSGSREEIPLKQIVSVRFYRHKSFVVGIAGTLGILLPFVINALFSDSLVAKISGVIVLLVGVGIAYLGIAGFPTVIITKAGDKVTQASGWPWDKNDAKGFALVLREQIK